MTQTRQLPGHPIVQVLLDWYAAAIEGEPASWLPKIASSGWHQRAEVGMVAGEWHDCEQCNGGVTRRGPCKNCAGIGGWNFDKYDTEEKRIGSDETKVERAMTLAEYDKALRDGKKPLSIEQQLALLSSPLHDPLLRKVEEILMRMRADYPYERGAIICIHVLRVDHGQPDRYRTGLDVMAAMFGEHFRPPPWIKETAARRQARRQRRAAA